MKLVVFILNRLDKLEELLCKFSESKISGATIIESTGMAQALYSMEDGAFLGSLRFFLDPNKEENRTIFMVLKEEQVAVAKQAIREVVGDLSEPNTGILFTLPIEEVEGLHK